MRAQIPLPLTLGTVAVASGTALVILDTIFAVTLSQTSSPTNTRITAIVASGVGSVSVALLLLLLNRQMRHRDGRHLKDLRRKQHTYLLAGFTGVSGVLSAVASALVLGIMRSRISELPKTIITSSTEKVIVGSFIVWAAALLSQAVFILCMVVFQRRDLKQHVQSFQPESAPEPTSELQEACPSKGLVPGSEYRGRSSMESSKTPLSSTGRSRAGSDSKASFRSSMSQVVRPITSKSRLISSKASNRPVSIESSTRETSLSTEDGFDSWDTSTVDAQSRQAVESASPTPPRILETIPASPTTSRSPSPGFPLDLGTPKPIKRSPNLSPAISNPELPRPRTTSPTESLSEAHIHPLFRTDSPTPPPPTTPGTMVIAAPGAGQVISDRASIRSIRRMRSGSLPSSPLMHQESFESMRKDVERDEEEKEGKEKGECRAERQLTPPIPEWILSGAPARNSMSAYSRRKPAELGKVGEVKDVQ